MRKTLFWVAALLTAVWLFNGEDSQPRTRGVSYSPDLKTSKNVELGTSPYIYTSSTFMGYKCLDDCSGHQAGYQWAEEHGIDDPDDCDGNSDSFIEGCQAYAQEQVDESEIE